jgi:Tfp pilus assembly PilM family ATPase
MRRVDRSGANAAVGLEITSDCIRAVEFGVRNGEPVVQRVAARPTPAGSVRDGLVSDPTLLSQKLQQIWEGAGFSTTRCCMALPASLLTQRMLTVPPAPPHEQRLIIASELGQSLPGRNSGPVGWMPMSSGGGAGGNTLAISADADALVGYERALALAGLELVTFEPEGIAALRGAVCALLRRSETLRGASVDSDLALVFISRSCCEVTFLEAGHPRFWRRLDMGDGVLSRAAQTETSSVVAAADTGWPDGFPPGRGAATISGVFEPHPVEGDKDWLAKLTTSYGPDSAPVFVDTEEVRAIAGEIDRSLRYYGRAYADAPQPSKLVLVSSGVPLEDLAQLLKEEQTLLVECLSPVNCFSRATTTRESIIGEEGDALSVALGMALGATADAGKQLALRLVPQAAASGNADRAAGPRWVLGGSVGLLAAAVIASSLLTHQLSGLQTELRDAQARFQTVDRERQTSAARDERVQRLVAQMKREGMPAGPLLAYLGSALPETTGLASVELRPDGALFLEGTARTSEDVGKMLQGLSRDGRLRPFSVESLETQRSDGLCHFRVRSGLVGYGVPSTGGGTPS